MLFWVVPRPSQLPTDTVSSPLLLHYSSISLSFPVILFHLSRHLRYKVSLLAAFPLLPETGALGCFQVSVCGLHVSCYLKLVPHVVSMFPSVVCTFPSQLIVPCVCMQECYIEEDMSSLAFVARAIMDIQRRFGVIPNVKCKGVLAKVGGACH